jgi:hypothetical protein
MTPLWGHGDLLRSRTRLVRATARRSKILSAGKISVMMRVGAQSVASDQALAEFRMRVAQLRRQRWRQIEYSEDPAEALLYMPDEGRDSFKGRGFAARSGGRQPTWRRVRVNDAGKVVTEDVDPPESPEPSEPSEPESAPG